MPISTVSCGENFLCSLCWDFCDPFGDHAVTCVKTGLWSRHNNVAETIALQASLGGLSVESEVAIKGKERPADLLIKPWKTMHPAAVDVTIVHPLTNSNCLLPPCGVDVFNVY